MSDMWALPNPSNSPIEKIDYDTYLENISPQLSAILSDNPTKDEILRAFNYYDENLRRYFERHDKELKYWANIHTHSGVAGGDNLLTIPDEWEFVGGTTNWEARRFRFGGQVGDTLWLLPGLKASTATNILQTNAVDLSTLLATPTPPASLSTDGTAPQRFWAAPLDGRIYTIQNTLFSGTAPFESYSIAGDVWASHTQPDQRGALCSISGNPYIWLVGDTDLKRYDPSTDAWANMTPPLQVADANSQGVFGHDGYLYVFGGVLDSGRSPSVQRYTPSTNSWEFLEPSPIAFSNPTFCVLSGRVYIFDIGGNVRTAQTLVYTFSTDSWEVRGLHPNTTPSLNQRANMNTANLQVVEQDRILVGHEYIYG